MLKHLYFSVRLIGETYFHSLCYYIIIIKDIMQQMLYDCNKCANLAFFRLEVKRPRSTSQFQKVTFFLLVNY